LFEVCKYHAASKKLSQGLFAKSAATIATRILQDQAANILPISDLVEGDIDGTEEIKFYLEQTMDAFMR